MFGSQIHALPETNIYWKKHKIESTVYTFIIPSVRGLAAIIQQLIAIWRLVIRYNKGWADPWLVSKKCGKKEMYVGSHKYVKNGSITAKLRRACWRTSCTNMHGTIPDLILGILWNGVKWTRMASQGKITWNYWKTPGVSKKTTTLC